MLFYDQYISAAQMTRAQILQRGIGVCERKGLHLDFDRNPGGDLEELLDIARGNVGDRL